MQWASKAFLHDDVRTLRMATLDAARLLGKGSRKGSILPGKDADIMVIDKSSNNLRCSKNLLSSLVRRARPDDISHFISGGKIWQNSSRKY
jgi:cytosine/adenosine deaminase-related metal-dependent hydrolase